MTTTSSSIHRTGATLGLLLLACLGLTACGDDDGGSSGGPQVVAASYPFEYVAERVGGDLVDVQNLTSPGAEPHDVELSPRQVADVGEADLLVYEHGFQPAVDDAVAEAELAGDAVLDVADAADAAVTGFSAEHDHAEGEHADEEHADEELDPHVWLDPVRMQQITTAVEEHLAAVDPQNSDAYRANAQDLLVELRALDRSFETRLAECERRTIVTGHAAFAYLADRYDLTQVAIAGLDPSAEPTPAQQALVADLVTEQGITTIFTEALASSAVAESIADETGVSLAQLDPIEGLSDDTADEDYLSLMESNLAAIAEANGCS